MMRVCIVGFGLIGGSLGMALKSRLAAHVSAVDREAVLASSQAAEASDERIPIGASDKLERAVREADLTVVAVPVLAAVQMLPSLLDSARSVTDCASTKRAMVQSVVGHRRRHRYVPGHPMAGSESGGIESARPELFEGRTWMLCPDGVAGDSKDLVESMITGVGAKPVRIDIEQHDRAVALTSHLPQLLASSLAVLAARRGARCAAGPAFADATRVAGGPERVWRDIFETNADEVAAALRELIATLEPLAGELEQHQVAATLDLLDAARSSRKQ